MLVIKNAKIYTSANKVYENGVIIVESGKIKAVGENIEIPNGAEVIDASGLIATPGIIDAHSHIGGFGSTMAEQDLNEMTANATPQVESLYSIDTFSKDFERVIKVGITTSAVAPGSGNVIGGMVCAVKSAGKNIDEMCIKNPVALKMALGGNPKNQYGKRGQLPMTRMGVAQVIRENMQRATEYMKKQNEAKGDATKMPPYDQGLENIAKALRREIPVKVHCEQYDMLTTIRIAKEFNLDFTLDHAWGSSDFYDEIASSGVRGVIFGPIGVGLSPGECGKVDIESVIELDRRGVVCSIMTDGPILNPEMIVAQAGEVYRFGGEITRVLNMLTINAAKIVGIDERTGSLEVGKDADILLFSGMPAVDTNATVLYTIIDGKIVYKK